MAYFVYENWVAHGHQARIHDGNCGNCQHGNGKHPNAGIRNGCWHGPFVTIAEAMAAAQRTGGKVRFCMFCLRRAAQTRS